MPKKYLLFLSIVTAVLGLLGFGIIYKANQVDGLRVNGKAYSTEIVATDEMRQRGLSGRDMLPQDTAMLFVFDASKTRCFWMKDMKFSIDIVWLDDAKRTVAIERNVSPDTYPSSFCHDNARYVVEFMAGQADAMSLKNGDQFSF